MGEIMLEADLEHSAGRKRAVPAQGSLDFPINYLVDVSFRDLQDLMQRPFFSLSKRKRVRPIEYISPDKSATVIVTATPAYGMATIWDSDIIIYLVSHLNQLRLKGVNDLSPVINIQPGDMLRRIGWGTGGKAYERLTLALDRLQTTSIKTNIRAKNKTRETTFSWIDSWTHLVDEETNRPLGMEITMSRWLFEGAIEQRNLLSIAQSYFEITSGIAKWLYRVGRKHAGGNGQNGYVLTLETLYHKSGSESQFSSFKKMISDIVEKNDLPDIHLAWVDASAAKLRLRMTMRRHMNEDDALDGDAPQFEADQVDTKLDLFEKVAQGQHTERGDDFVPPSATFALLAKVQSANRDRMVDPLAPQDKPRPVTRTALPKAKPKQRAAQRLPDAERRIGSQLYQQIRSECPGLDVNETMRAFDSYLNVNPNELPARYDIRFAAFARQHYLRNISLFR